MHLVIISGMSGGGKSYALHNLEDSGYYCIDNLPSQLLEALLGTAQIANQTHLAIGIDIRGGKASVAEIPTIIKRVRQRVPNTQLIYLYSDQDTLRKRYNESRRRHPLSSEMLELDKAISLEASLLNPLSINADLRIDTSHTSIYDLGHLLNARINQAEPKKLSLMVQSFGFKHEAPSDTDFLFDVRCLPNPYWVPELRHLTGKDPGIVNWLETHNAVHQMYHDIRDFLDRWLPNQEGHCQRAYLTVSIGCTGGHHRSVYLAERLYQHFHSTLGDSTVLRHRELNDVR